MAIKKRSQNSPAREAEIEAFGAAAESTAPTQGESSASGANSAARLGMSGEKPKVKTLLVRLDPDEHQLLQEVAALESRSMANMLKMILIPGLKAVKQSHQK